MATEIFFGNGEKKVVVEDLEAVNQKMATNRPHMSVFHQMERNGDSGESICVNPEQVSFMVPYEEPGRASF